MVGAKQFAANQNVKCECFHYAFKIFRIFSWHYIPRYPCMCGCSFCYLMELDDLVEENLTTIRDDVIKLEMFSQLSVLCEGNPSVTGGFPHKGQ